MEIKNDEEAKLELEEPTGFTIDPGIPRVFTIHNLWLYHLQLLKLFLDFTMDPEILGETIVSVILFFSKLNLFVIN